MPVDLLERRLSFLLYRSIYILKQYFIYSLFTCILIFLPHLNVVVIRWEFNVSDVKHSVLIFCYFIELYVKCFYYIKITLSQGYNEINTCFIPFFFPMISWCGLQLFNIQLDLKTRKITEKYKNKPTQ